MFRRHTRKHYGRHVTRRRLYLALGIYVALVIAYLPLMPRERLHAHTPANHYALQAEAWLAGRLDLGGPPPAYTRNNDFALYQGKHYVSFPPVPAALLLPLVAAAGGAEALPDGLVFALLAPLSAVFLFLTLERLRERGRSSQTETHNLEFTVLFALGSVYWFTAVQGTVWFAGHVVAAIFLCAYLFFGLEARQPILAGLCLALAIGTRPPVALALPFFVYELYKSAPRAELAKRAVGFAAPMLVVLVALAWHNKLRFGDPLEFGHHYLTVIWRKRIEAHGLFSYRYLGRNLAVMLTSLPFHTKEAGWQINGHGLALWLTSPFYLLALWPRSKPAEYWVAIGAAGLVAVPNLLYQNSGWLQFGYRFSNDFAPLLIIALALSGRTMLPVRVLGAIALVVNCFGAVTFDKDAYAHWYFVDQTQRIVEQPL
jgi:hypothetical protein